ncbi:MAG: hypothetical protein ACREDV_12945, partial [Methylocella sp.]
EGIMRLAEQRQGLAMLKLRGGVSRWEAAELSQLEAAELLGRAGQRCPRTLRFTSQRQEAKQVKILLGVYQGEMRQARGTPIALLLEDFDQRSRIFDTTESSPKSRAAGGALLRPKCKRSAIAYSATIAPSAVASLNSP